MLKLFSKKITVFFLLLVLNFFVDPKPLHSCENAPTCAVTPESLHSMEPYALPSQEQLVSEVKGLIDSTPTGFTFLLKEGASNLGVLVSCSWQFLKHPLTSTKQLCSKAYGTTKQVICWPCSIVASGVVNGYKTVRHPIETAKSVKKMAQNAGSLVLKITLHPVDNVSKLLKFCDEIKVDDLPLINKLGNIGNKYLQQDGFIKITPDKCPGLHSMLMQTAQRLGLNGLDKIYVYKGNFISNVCENLGLIDFSCNAMALGITHGIKFTYIGKDLILGVNHNQASHVPGMTPEHLQAICAHEMSHHKFRHMFKKIVVNFVIAGFLTWVLIDIFLDSVKNRSQTVKSLYDMVDDRVFNPTICVGAVCFYSLKQVLNMLSNALFKQGFSRHCEREADTNALRALDNPSAMASGLVKLNSLATLKRRPLKELFQTHPDFGTRVNYLQEEAAKVLKERENKPK